MVCYTLIIEIQKGGNTMEYALKTYNISKKHQEKMLLDYVTIAVKKGEIYGFLGENGAGKTTLMKVLTNLVYPDSGEVEILGKIVQNNSFEYLRNIGSLIEQPRFIQELSAIENLQLHCKYIGFYQKDAIENTINLLNMQEYVTQKAKTYSLGMKQRLGIALAIVHKPNVLILDEPFNGLDPEGMKLIRELLKVLSRDYGTSIMISSHILPELELIADTIGIIHKGKMVNELSMSEIKNINTNYYVLETPNIQEAVVALSQKLGISNFKVMDERTLRIYDQTISKNNIIKLLLDEKIEIDSISSKINSLEDYFFDQTEEGDIHD